MPIAKICIPFQMTFYCQNNLMNIKNTNTYKMPFTTKQEMGTIILWTCENPRVEIFSQLVILLLVFWKSFSLSCNLPKLELIYIKNVKS